MILQIWIF